MRVGRCGWRIWIRYCAIQKIEGRFDLPKADKFGWENPPNGEPWASGFSLVGRCRRTAYSSVKRTNWTNNLAWNKRSAVLPLKKQNDTKSLEQLGSKFGHETGVQWT